MLRCFGRNVASCKLSASLSMNTFKWFCSKDTSLTLLGLETESSTAVTESTNNLTKRSLLHLAPILFIDIGVLLYVISMPETYE